MAVWVAAQPAAGSPSLTDRLTVAGPGALQVKVGFCAAALPASLPCAVADKAMVPPTWTSAGLALMPSMVGQMLILPETITLPVRGASRQDSDTGTETVWPAVTLNIAEPAQLVEPSVLVAESV